MTEDFVRKKGYLALGTRFRRLSERLFNETQQVMEARGITLQSGQYPSLAALDELGPLNIGELAVAIGISQPGITRIVGQLVKLDLVEVKRSSSDQRQRVVELTGSGKEAVAFARIHVWPHIESCLQDIMAGRSGPLLDQLDHLEDALKEKSFKDRILDNERRNQ